jgi:hypothetical protein
MRDKVIHDYFGVNLEIVWVVVQKELPKLNVARNGLWFLRGSQRSGLSHFVNQGAGLITSGGRLFSGLSREFAQLFGIDPQFFKRLDPDASLVVVVELVRQHDAVILLDGRPGVSDSTRNLGPLFGVDVLYENPPSRRDKSFRLSDRSGTVGNVFDVLGLMVKLLLPILEDRSDGIDGERLGRVQN